MNAPRSQRGFLLILAVIIIMVAAVMAAAIATLTSGGGQSGGLHEKSTQALYAAEAGLERALYGFSKQGAGCAALGYTGTLTIASVAANYSTSATVYAPASTALFSNITASVTTIPVNAITSYASHGRLTIDSEAINYTGTSTSTTVCGAGVPACFTGATRGAGGTAAAAHASGASVAQSQCLITSVGTSENAKRTVERAVSASGSSTGAMAVYAKANGSGVPYYRIWNGSSWGAEQTALTVGTTGNDIRIQFIVLKYARTRNEALLGIQYHDNTIDQTEISVQRWNGSNWAGLTSMVTGIGGGERNRRGFDIEYETARDRAVVAYRRAGNNQPYYRYRIWDGSSWSGESTIDLSAVLTDSLRWIELAPNPLSTSNDIALITIDRDEDVYGMRWNGNAGVEAWDDMDSTSAVGVWSTDGADSGTKAIDVAYEQSSGDALFIWGRDSNDNQYYRTLPSGGNLTTRTNLPIGPMGGTAQWVRLAPRPSSNQILYGVQDSGGDLNTCLWSGSAWDCATTTHTEHDSGTEEPQSRNFDIVFETYVPNAGRAWLVWGNGSTVSIQKWDPGDAACTITPSWCTATTTGDRTNLVQLMAHPTSGVVLAAIYEDQSASADDIRETHLPAGGSWSALTDPSTTSTDPFWAGQTVGNPVNERVTIGVQRSGNLTLYDWLEVFP